MPPKRKRNASLPPKGFSPGEQLKRNAIPRPNSSSSTPWGWVGSEVVDASEITREHLLAACNIATRNRHTLCRNKFSNREDHVVLTEKPLFENANGEVEEDVIVISDDEWPVCSKKGCKNNPYCLNHLGQDAWEDEDEAKDAFMKAADLGCNPLHSSREPGLPVGLKNLGATCYANASLQVWFRDLAFRSGVYSCEPPENISEEKYKDSPIFQLQVTFAALQEGNQNIFNPAKLVESLQLRITEQQDAQEFSKLFMSHLDAEFKKQKSPSLKSLVTDQFQGNQIYGTICHSCNYRSERKSDFLEIEISFKANAKLEECIVNSLLPETLSGDNQYSCSGCDSMQDATRYTEFKEFPLVLHFSLLRFIYDLNTMERKKSKHSISFPLTLDMKHFLGSKEDRQNAASDDNQDNLYELRGVLLHKGASAYHGHYEAQVNDVENGSWFLFNDEDVAKINSLGDGSRKMGNDAKLEEEDEKPGTSDIRKKRANAKKRRRIEDSDDDEVVVVNRKSSPKVPEKGTSNLITSKDAYMLIYAKKGSSHNGEIEKANQGRSTTTSWPKPSPRAMNVIQRLDNSHDAACKLYKERLDRVNASFANLRNKVRAIYSEWTTSPLSESVLVSRQALSAWLSTDCIKATLKQDESFSSSEATGSGCIPKDGDKLAISNAGIACEHARLDPMKYQDIRCISRAAYEKILTETGCRFEPFLNHASVCVDCVMNAFREKLYEIEHPLHVKQFDEVAIVPDDEYGFWISKKWYKDWRLMKPRMHVAHEDDPSPNSCEFNSHVFCEHGGLSLNITNRRKISAEAVTLLRKLFPSWQPPSTDFKTCATCDAEVHISKEDKKEIRRRVEDEKARLRFIYEPTLDSWTNVAEDASDAIIPSQFVKNWKRWLHSPSDNPQPDIVDNRPFMCEHDLLAIDPNCPTDLDSSITIIQRKQWNVLHSIYQGGPLIVLSKRSDEDGGGYDHDIPVCTDCRVRRRTEWDTADIVIRLCQPDATPNLKAKQTTVVTYGRTNGGRQSKRLRQIKEHGERRVISVSKSSSVKDIKIMIHEEFSIPTICQRLFHQGRELENNSATVDTLQILANDVIDIREAEESVEVDSDCDEPPARKRRRDEGLGFGGTLLGKSDSPWSSSPEQTPQPAEREKACHACTFSNALDALLCQICETAFA